MKFFFYAHIIRPHVLDEKKNPKDCVSEKFRRRFWAGQGYAINLCFPSFVFHLSLKKRKNTSRTKIRNSLTLRSRKIHLFALWRFPSISLGVSRSTRIQNKIEVQCEMSRVSKFFLCSSLPLSYFISCWRLAGLLSRLTVYRRRNIAYRPVCCLHETPIYARSTW